MTTPLPQYELLRPTFATQRQAFHWAWQVARTAGKHCRVTKLGDRWRVMRLINHPSTKDKVPGV